MKTCSECQQPAMPGAKRCQLHFHGSLACLIEHCSDGVTGQESGILSCFCEEHDNLWVFSARNDPQFDRNIDLSQNMVLWLQRLKEKHNGTRVS